jgi:thiamine biosynthesis protein ThiI
MHFVIKLFPEIVIKSPPVRRQQSKTLEDNIRRLVKPLSKGMEVVRDWEKLELICDNDNPEVRMAVIDRLSCIPGISKFSESETHEFESLEHICSLSVEKYREVIKGKSFGVRSKRSGDQDFNSMDVERAVGSALMVQTKADSVNLTNPDLWVELEVRQDRVFMLGETWPGLGGFPLGSQDKLISLISGGFNSSVSSFQSIRQGMLTHFIFFNIGGRAHEIAVREMVHHIWSRYGSSHNSRFISVPFEQIVVEISKKAPSSYSTVLLKVFMMRCASKVAVDNNIDAISTGESVGQVSSQALSNLRLIDEDSKCLVMRPLINMDKGEIIDIARKIGTAQMVEGSPEYCGLRSDRRTARARRDKIEAIEALLDPNLVDEAVAQAQQMLVSKIIEDIATLPVDILPVAPAGAVIVDVRHPDERLDRELELEGSEVIVLPFYEIQKTYMDQPQDRSYLLYCERGIMSRLHAELLLEAGYKNVGVYRP